MIYEGKLYGSIDDKTFFETGKTSKDWDRLEEAVKAAWIAMDSIDDAKADEWQDEFADIVFPSVNVEVSHD